MKRNLTCIVCPMGCDITVTFDENNTIASISGNSCKRGALYAESECTHPTRTLTTTAMCENGRPVPVKSNTPVPKDKMFECMKIINAARVALPVKAGDIIVKNIVNSGSDIIAVQNME